MTRDSCEYWSKDSRFGVRLAPQVIRDILDYARRSDSIETGGILVGRYSADHSCALVDQATGPPDDSRSSPSWFARGIKGLQALLNTIWRAERRYYLGEWHYHPDHAPVPSPSDTTQMAKIASSDSYACPEPVLLILGGDPNTTWQIGVFVYHRNEQSAHLLPRDSRTYC